MASRVDPRHQVRLKVELAGVDFTGHKFKQTVFTHDISSRGARLEHTPPIIQRASAWYGLTEWAIKLASKASMGAASGAVHCPDTRLAAVRQWGTDSRIRCRRKVAPEPSSR